MTAANLDRGVLLASGRAREANRGFVPLVLASVVLHLGAGAGVVLAASLGARPRLETASIPVELVTLGKPRDPELLPRKVKPRVAEPEPAPVAETPEPAPDAVALDGAEKKPRKPKRKPARKLSRAARALLEEADDARLDEALDKLEPPPEGSSNGSIYGTTTDPSAAANTYEAQVKALLQERYKLPLTVAPSQRRFLEAEVVLYVDPSGRITRFEFTKRHANQAFMSALEGLLRSTELPAPPNALARTYAREGLAIRFKP